MEITKRRSNQWRGVLSIPLLFCAFLCTRPARCQQPTAGEDLEFRGNGGEIDITVHDGSGQPLSTPATVKLYREGTPYDQKSTSKGRVSFIVHPLGEFSVTVEAAGYKLAQKDVSLPHPAKTEVDIRLERDTASNFTIGDAGTPILAPKAKEALDRGTQALRDDNLEVAEKELEHAMKLAPSNPDILYAQGVLDLKRRDWLKAQSVLEKAAQIEPNRARTLSALGMALCNGKKYEEALAPLEKSLQLDATSGWETHYALAQAYYHLERYDEALKTSQQAQAESNGQAPQVDLLVAQAFTAVGRFKDSAQVLREIIKMHPGVPEAATAQRFLQRLTADGKIPRD